jgi:ABC-type bacteriocin/lantibiotic exporter with double-glycine peptidase domain
VKNIGITLLKIVKEVYKVSKKHFLIVLVLTVFSGISPVLSLWVLREVINTIAYSSDLQVNQIMLTLLLFGGVNLVIRINQTLKNYVITKQRLKVEYYTGRAVLKKCEALGISDFENGEKYNIIAKGENEGRMRIYMTYQNILGVLLQLVSLFSVIAVVLTWKSYVFLLVLITPFLTTFLNTRINFKYYETRMKRMQSVRKISYIQYLLTNDIACKEIKTYRVGGYLIDMYSKLLVKTQKQDIEMAKQKGVVEVLTSILDEGIGIFVLFHIIKLTITGIIKIGDTVAYFDSLSVVQNSISSLLNLISSLYTDSMYVAQYYNLMDLEVDDTVASGIEVHSIETIEFCNVSYKYESSDYVVLKDINVKIQKGETVVIVGENGSGKSTLVKLMCGFYKNYHGQIYINGLELSRIDSDSLRKTMGIVFQDFNKYELSLRENIGLGNLASLNNDIEIWNILKTVGLEEKTKQFDGGLETQMGHWFSGEQLSKGQWQRIALARAFLNNASAYIFDEPTASLDPKIEREIYQLMKAYGQNNVCIFVTHRFDNIEALNPRVIIMSDGIIENDAHHFDLVESSDMYRELIGA